MRNLRGQPRVAETINNRGTMNSGSLNSGSMNSGSLSSGSLISGSLSSGSMNIGMYLAGGSTNHSYGGKGSLGLSSKDQQARFRDNPIQKEEPNSLSRSREGLEGDKMNK